MKAARPANKLQSAEIREIPDPPFFGEGGRGFNFCCLRLAALHPLSVHYGVSTIRKWLMLTPCNHPHFFAFFH